MQRGDHSEDSRIDSKEIFQRIFLGFSEGDLAFLTSYYWNRKERVKIIKIFPDDGPHSNLVLIERNGRREIVNIALLRP